MKTSVNLTIIFCAVAVLAIAGVAGGVALTISDKDASSFYAFFTSLVVTVTGFGGLVYGQNKIANQVDAVETKVNGNLSKLIEIAVAKATGESPLTRRDAKVIRDVAASVPNLETGEIPVEDTEIPGKEES